jgi:hypothetical protein
MWCCFEDLREGSTRLWRLLSLDRAVVARAILERINAVTALIIIAVCNTSMRSLV